MRILVVTTWYPSAARPSEAPFTHEHVKAIARRNDVRVIHVQLGASGEPATETYDGVRVRRVPLSPRRPLSVLRTWRIIRHALRDADILHTMAFSAVLVAAAGHLFTGAPWVHTEHWNGVSNPSSVGRTWVRLAWLRHALRLPNRLTGVTTQLADVLARFGRPGAASVVPCVVENDAPVTSAAFAEPLELIAVGALIERKQPLMAVRTLSWLREHGQAAHLTWIGGGELADATLSLASELGVANQLTLAGTMPPRAVFDRLGSADLFFLPTAQENFFTSAAEALSAGRAVVVPHVGGYDDYVGPSNGILVEEDSPEAYGAAILRAAEQFRTVDATAIADPIRLRFSAQTVGDEFDAIYGELLPASRGNGPARP
jgi:glycosyltransferase involved in cell wall biosynthesis